MRITPRPSISARSGFLASKGKAGRLTGVDPDGADLRRGGRVGRLDFSVPVDDTDNIRQAFIALAQSARRDEAPP